MVEPAVVSPTRWRGASRATSAIWTPFQLETVTPPIPARSATAQNGAAGVVAARASEVDAEAAATSLSVNRPEPSRSDTQRRGEREAEAGGEIGDEEGGPAALADRKAGAGEGEARQPRRAPQRGERAGEVLRTEERARRQRLMAAAVGVDAWAQRLHEGDRRDDDGGREDERRAPARRLGDRRQRHAGEDAADRNAGLLDEKMR